MEIIHAKTAYANTLLAEQHLLDSMITCFNNKVRLASMEGKRVCHVLWKEFDIDENYATDCEATATLLDVLLGAGYDVEFCYNGRTVFNPCGVVAAWGPYSEGIIEEFFYNAEDLYRGE